MTLGEAVGQPNEVRTDAVRSVSRARLAWSLATLGAIGCALSAVLTIALGLGSIQLIVTGLFAAMAVLGGFIATRRPDNGVGWLMIASGILATFLFLPTDYGYLATVAWPGTLPVGTAVLWLGAWSWAPLLGTVLPLIAVRFPDGRRAGQWWAVDWIVIIGTVGFAASIALAQGPVLARYLPIASGSAAGAALSRVATTLENPLGLAIPADSLEVVRVASVVVIVAGYALAIAAVVDRFRRAEGSERLQLLWFGYAVGLGGAAAAYALVAWGFLGAQIGDSLLPLDFAAFGVPIAVTIGILRYQLLDIELVVNQTLVYGVLTAILAAAYAATITLLQRLLVGVSGTTSNAVYVFAAFVVVVAFSPLRDWLQRQVDRRLGRRHPAAVLSDLRTSFEGVLDALEPQRAAGRLLDEAIRAFEARGGALSLDNPEGLQLVRGSASDGAVVEVPIRHAQLVLGRLELGPRRGGRHYSEGDQEALQEAADAVGDAIAFAARMDS